MAINPQPSRGCGKPNRTRALPHSCACLRRSTAGTGLVTGREWGVLDVTTVRCHSGALCRSAGHCAGPVAVTRRLPCLPPRAARSRACAFHLSSSGHGNICVVVVFGGGPQTCPWRCRNPSTHPVARCHGCSAQSQARQARGSAGAVLRAARPPAGWRAGGGAAVRRRRWRAGSSTGGEHAYSCVGRVVRSHQQRHYCRQLRGGRHGTPTVACASTADARMLGVCGVEAVRWCSRATGSAPPTIAIASRP